MHSFRLRYIALGLLIYIQSAYSRTCARDFDDIASNTARSTFVFEGRANREIRVSENSTMYLVRFRVRQVLKGPHDYLSRNESREKDFLTVGFFADESSPDCLPNRIKIKSTYIVFANLSNDALTQQQRHNSDILTDNAVFTGANSPDITIDLTSPVPISKLALEEVKKNSCENCARRPSIKKMRKGKDTTEGKRVRLSCRVAGKPKPNIIWFKDGIPLVYNTRTKVTEKTRGSQLTILKTRPADSGVYQCEAINVFGPTGRFNTTLRVKANPQKEKRHSTLCEEQTFCLNGGTCYFTTLRQQYCQCANGYIGRRCEELNIGENSLMTLQKDGTYGKRKRSPRLKRHRHHRTVIREDYFLLAEIN